MSKRRPETVRPVPLTVELTREQYQKIEAIAHEQGYRTTADFIHTLLLHMIESPAELNHAILRLLAPEGDADDQAYFWTEEWQAAERKVDEEIAAGQYKDFDTMEDFLADLTSDDE